MSPVCVCVCKYTTTKMTHKLFRNNSEDDNLTLRVERRIMGNEKHTVMIIKNKD